MLRNLLKALSLLKAGVAAELALKSEPELATFLAQVKQEAEHCSRMLERLGINSSREEIVNAFFCAEEFRQKYEERKQKITSFLNTKNSLRALRDEVRKDIAIEEKTEPLYYHQQIKSITRLYLRSIAREQQDAEIYINGCPYSVSDCLIRIHNTKDMPALDRLEKDIKQKKNSFEWESLPSLKSIIPVLPNGAPFSIADFDDIAKYEPSVRPQLGPMR